MPDGHHRLIQRVIPVVRARRGAEREVEHANNIGVFVGDHPINGPDYIRIGARAVRVHSMDPKARIPERRVRSNGIGIRLNRETQT